jgi:hypothetical protein
MVHGKLHSLNGTQRLRNLTKWVRNYPGAAPGDIAAAEKAINDLTHALECDP